LVSDIRQTAGAMRSIQMVLSIGALQARALHWVWVLS